MVVCFSTCGLQSSSINLHLGTLLQLCILFFFLQDRVTLNCPGRILVCNPSVSGSPSAGHHHVWLEMCIFRSHPRPTESDRLHWASEVCKPLPCHSALMIPSISWEHVLPQAELVVTWQTAAEGCTDCNLPSSTESP